MRATITPREEMVRNWERAMPPPEPATDPLPRALNLERVLDLGNMVFFTFRGRAYGIPPLAWKEGEKILDLYLALGEFGNQLKRQDLKAYYDTIHRLQKLLWRNCRPSGPFRRLLRFLRLHRNPFKRATEGEIVELAVFTLGRRMRLREGAGPADHEPETS